MAVFVFPPIESCSNRVNLDYRYGAMLLPVANDPMTLPKVVRERLMFLSYSKCYPVIVSPLCIFYEPAKSQRLIFIL